MTGVQTVLFRSSQNLIWARVCGDAKWIIFPDSKTGPRGMDRTCIREELMKKWMVDFPESCALCRPLQLIETVPECTRTVLKLNQTEPRLALGRPPASPWAGGRDRSDHTHHLSNSAVTMVSLRLRNSASVIGFGGPGFQFSPGQSWFSLGTILVQFGTVWFSFGQNWKYRK